MTSEEAAKRAFLFIVGALLLTIGIAIQYSPAFAIINLGLSFMALAILSALLR